MMRPLSRSCSSMRLFATCLLSLMLLAPLDSAVGWLPAEGPTSITMSEKIQASHFVFVGEALRVYFVDLNNVEVAEPLQSVGFSPAIVDIRVVEHLHPSATQLATTLRIRAVATPQTIESMRERYVGKRLIYFTRTTKVTLYFEQNHVTRRREEPEILHYLPLLRPMKGPWANPLPMDNLPEVRKSLAASPTPRS